MKPGPNAGPTPAQQERICSLIRGGAYLETAAAAAGVTSRTVRNWIAYADEGADSFVLFRDAFLTAAADAEHRALLLIGAAMREDWRAAAWFLERRHPRRWGRDERPREDEKLESVAVSVGDPWERAESESEPTA